MQRIDEAIAATVACDLVLAAAVFTATLSSFQSHPSFRKTSRVRASAAIARCHIDRATEAASV